MTQQTPNRPILIFPAATITAREGLGQMFIPPPPRPSKNQQSLRLGRRFQDINNQFGTIQADIGGIDPEQVIVFETIGSVSSFQNVVKRIAGMEWLGDFEADIADPDPGFLSDGASEASLPGRLFVLVGNRSAYTELQRLWNLWRRSHDEKLPRNFGGLAEVFKYLQDVHPWGPKDRVQATGIVASWQQGLLSHTPRIRFEIELWCRSEAAARVAAFNRLQTIVTETGGQCIKQCVVADIDYHAVLVELPADVVGEAVTAINAGGDTKLLRLTDVKYFAPMGQASIIPIPEGTPTIVTDAQSMPQGEPIVALLDGLPLANHSLLQGRLVVDDPDNIAARYGVGEHRHGTAMASLIIHGDLESHEAPIGTPLYVRPIMHPGQQDVNNQRWEVFPPDEFPVDVVHRAVKRIVRGDGGQPPQAPNVKVINLSLGDASQLFDRTISPWARLLDWLAWEYKILFVVSAGNHLCQISIPAPPNSITGMSDENLRAHSMRAMAGQRLQRRLLAPAESVNALTVGALHAQAGTVGTVGNLVDLLRDTELPSLINPVSSGFRRSIKPEILAPGGKRHYAPSVQPFNATNAEFMIVNGSAQPGQLVASPGGTGVPPNQRSKASGTSNATALTTRSAVRLIDRIAEMRGEPGGNVITDDLIAVILKAMLVHGASWDGLESLIEQVFDGTDSGMERHWRIKRACAQFLGYGVLNMQRGTVCSDQRAIVLGCGMLPFEKGHRYKIPLPPALNALKVNRKLTITLAWLTPTNPRHRNYCGADLWFDSPGLSLQVKRADANERMVKQGTIQHEVLSGDAAVPINAGDAITVQVNCRTDGGYRGDVNIPYALMVSLEIAQPLTVSIYDQIKLAIEQLRAPVAVRAGHA